MELKELLEVIKNTELTQQQKKEINKRIKEMDEEFESNAWKNRITQEWLNRTYSI